MSFRNRFALVVAAQVAIVLSLVVFKQITLLTGQRIWLRAAPVDPRDLLRGEYVALETGISRLEGPALWNGWDDDGVPEFAKGDTVYVVLRRDRGFQVAERVSRRRPDAPLFVRGTVTDVQHADSTGSRPVSSIGVSYGIESWFVPRGEGPALERAARAPGKMLAVQVSVDREGRAVLRQARVEPQDRPDRPVP